MKFFRALSAFCLLAGAAVSPLAYAQRGGPDGITLYDGRDFFGPGQSLDGPTDNFSAFRFNDKARSIDVGSQAWEVCEDSGFRGKCLVVRERIRDLDRFGFDDEISSARPLPGRARLDHGTVYERDYRGDLIFWVPDRYGNWSRQDQGYSSGGYGDDRYGHNRYGGSNDRGGGYGRGGGYDDPYGGNDRWQGRRGDRRADIVLYEHDRFGGASYGASRTINDLSAIDFNDAVSSIEIYAGVWDICEHDRFGGRCERINASVPSLGVLGLNDRISSIRRVVEAGPSRPGRPAPPFGGGAGSVQDSPVLLFRHGNYRGDVYGIDGPVINLGFTGLNDEVSSMQIRSGRWEVCTDSNFRGQCRVFDSSQPQLGNFRLNDNISSIRPR